MNKIIEWFTKKRFFVVSLVGVVVFFGAYSLVLSSSSCYKEKICSSFTEHSMLYTALLVSVFIFSLITFKLKESTFFAWKRFTFFAVLFTWFIVSLLPTYTHGLDFIPLTKGSASYVLTILYSIISLILIIYKSLQKGE